MSHVRDIVVYNRFKLLKKGLVPGPTQEEIDLGLFLRSDGRWSSVPVSLPDTGVTAGGYGSGESVPVFTVDAKGRLTAASELAILIQQSQVINLAADLGSKIPSSEKGVPLGVATLDAGGKLTSTQLPALSKSDVGLGNVENTALSTWAGSANITTLGTITTGSIPAANVSGLAAVATSGSYADLSGTPSLATVATSGSYSDLSGTPALGTAAAADTGDFATAAQGGLADSAVQPGDLAAVATTGAYSNLSGTPSLAAVATSGSYADLSNKPALGTLASQAASSVAITGGSITGITDLAVADGGTGASTASAARVNLLPSYTSNSGKVLAINSGATDVEWISVGGAGTVTSVDVSGGTTGLTTSGGPVTSSGTITLSGTLNVANGGTGATTASGARTALELGTLATQAASSVSITGGSINGTTIGATTPSTGAFTTLTASTSVTTPLHKFTGRTYAWIESPSEHNMGIIVGNNGSADGVVTFTNGSTSNPISITASHSAVPSKINFGSDTNLYRSSANTLKTDDNLIVDGNLTLSGTGKFILGDFSSAAANRPIFKTSTTNGATYLGVAPDGTGTGSGINLFGLSDVTTNSFRLGLTADSNNAGIINVLATGTATQRPLWLQIQSTTVATISSTGLAVTGSINSTLSVTGVAAAQFQNSHATGYGTYLKGGGAGGRYALLVHDYSGAQLMLHDGAGLAVTGELSATGQIGNNGSGSSAAAFTFSGYGTAGAYGRIINTGSTAIFGIQNSTGNGPILASGTAYAVVVGAQTNVPLYLLSNNAVVATVSSTGLAVTGAVSSFSSSSSNATEVDLINTDTGGVNWAICSTGSGWGGGSKAGRLYFNRAGTDIVYLHSGGLTCAGYLETTNGQVFVYGYGGAAQSSVIWQRGDQTSCIYHDGTNTTHRVGGNDTLVVSSAILGVNTASTTCAGSAVLGVNIGGNALTASLGLGINSTSDTGTQYFVGFGRNGSICGQIYSTGTNSTTYATSSDARLKASIEDFADSGRLIDALRPRTWKWKKDGTFGLGFIAQEQHASDPIFSKIGAVLVGDDGDEIKNQWMRSDAALVPILVAEIKSLRARVAALEASHA